MRKKTKRGQRSKKPAGQDQRAKEDALRDCAKRASTPKERKYFLEMIRELVENNAIPLELLEHVPVGADKAGKTRFEQVYDAAMHLAFPGYNEKTTERLFGPRAKEMAGTKIWRIMLPAKFGLSHVLIRARTMQEAFALGSDYACRMSLRIHRKIPADLTVRVQFVSDSALRRILDIRWANRKNKRRQLGLVGREFTPKEVAGARRVAMGRPSQPCYSIFRYAEEKDLLRVLKGGKTRISAVETESFRRDP